MSNDVTLPGTGAIVETLDTGAGQRQVITISPRDLSTNDSIGPLTETAPSTDTASSGLNGRLQRVAQNLTTANGNLTTINTSVSGVNTTLGTTNTSLGTINTSVGTVNTTLGTTNTSLGTINTTLGTTNTEVGSLTDTAPATDTASASLNGRLQRVAQRITSLLALLPSALTNAGGLQVGTHTINPSSTLTRPANATAYAQNELVASSTTAGSVAVPSVAMSGTAGVSGSVRRARLNTSATSGWGAVALRMDLWTAAPTFTNGDGGAFAVATGSAHWLGSMTFAGLTQNGDGACGIATPDTGGSIDFALSGTGIYWTLCYIGSASLTPTSGQTFTVTLEGTQD